MIKAIMHGCNGKMGQVITNICKEDAGIEIVAGIDVYDGIANDYPVSSNISLCNVPADVIIDFSTASAIDDLLVYSVEKQIPVVLCTTGLSEEDIRVLEEVSKEVPVFRSANMSLGVNLLIDLVKKAAGMLYNNFDIEIIEKHHNKKIDAPSGTALMIADEISETIDDNITYTYDRHSQRKKREKQEIGIHAVRGGTIVGEHDVIFAGKDEIITVSHTAMSKEIFATGSISAAKFIYNKAPGLYSMKNIMGE